MSMYLAVLLSAFLYLPIIHTPRPAQGLEFPVATLLHCDPDTGVTYVQGTTYKGGQPVSGDTVVFSDAPDGPVVASMLSGPHDGYPGWRPGFYSHVIQHDGPREGDWYFWIVNSGGQRISAIAHVRTDGVAAAGTCQQAIIDFNSR